MDGKMQFTALQIARPMPETSRVFLDAGLLIGALKSEDPRHFEAFSIVESARKGDLKACTSVGILSEVYAALTWIGAKPPLTPNNAKADASRSLQSFRS